MWCIIYLYKKRGTGWELEKGYGKGVGMRERQSKFNCVGIREGCSEECGIRMVGVKGVGMREGWSLFNCGGIREGCSEECGIRVVAVKGVGMREGRSKIKEGMTDHKVLR